MAEPTRSGDDIIVSVTIDLVLNRNAFDLEDEGFEDAVDYTDDLVDSIKETLALSNHIHTAGLRTETKAGPRTEPQDGRPCVKARDSYGRQYLYTSNQLNEMGEALR